MLRSATVEKLISGRLVLVTDGKENVSPYLPKLCNLLEMLRTVPVSVIRIEHSDRFLSEEEGQRLKSGDTDYFRQLASHTGGRFYLVSGQSTVLLSATFIEIAQRFVTDSKIIVKTNSQTELLPGKNVEFPVILDGAGEDMLVAIQFDVDHFDLVEVSTTILDPYQREIGKEEARYQPQPEFKMVYITVSRVDMVSMVLCVHHV